MKKKWFLAGFLLFVLVGVFDTCSPAKAAEVDVNITAEAANVDVTVPTMLPIVFRADGSNAFPENFTITNNSKAADIYLAKVEMNANGSGWQLLGEQEEIEKLTVDARNMKFYIGKEDDLKLIQPDDGTTSAKGSYTFQSEDIVIAKEQSQTLTFDAERAAFTYGFASEKAFQLVFSFDWKRIPVLVTGREFVATIPDGVNKIVFSDEKAPEGVALTDVSEAKNQSVVSWTSAGIYYVSAQKQGVKIMANQDCSEMFSNSEENLYTVEYIDVSLLDTSEVTDMGYMFYYVGKTMKDLQIKGINEWNTSKVMNMSHMFDRTGFDTGRYGHVLDIGDLSGWDTSSVTDMSYMFYQTGYNAENFDIGDLSGWNTSSVTDMSYMFYQTGYNAISFSMNLRSWNVINVEHDYNFNEGVNYKIESPFW